MRFYNGINVESVVKLLGNGGNELSNGGNGWSNGGNVSRNGGNGL